MPGVLDRLDAEEQESRDRRVGVIEINLDLRRARGIVPLHEGPARDPERSDGEESDLRDGVRDGLECTDRRLGVDLDAGGKRTAAVARGFEQTDKLPILRRTRRNDAVGGTDDRRAVRPKLQRGESTRVHENGREAARIEGSVARRQDVQLGERVPHEDARPVRDEFDGRPLGPADAERREIRLPIVGRGVLACRGRNRGDEHPAERFAGRVLPAPDRDASVLDPVFDVRLFLDEVQDVLDRNIPFLDRDARNVGIGTGIEPDGELHAPTLQRNGFVRIVFAGQVRQKRKDFRESGILDIEGRQDDSFDLVVDGLLLG